MMHESEEIGVGCERSTLPAIRQHPAGDIIDADAVQADEEIRLGRMM